jgi:hypothetical protein
MRAGFALGGDKGILKLAEINCVFHMPVFLLV